MFYKMISRNIQDSQYMFMFDLQKKRDWIKSKQRRCVNNEKKKSTVVDYNLGNI